MKALGIVRGFVHAASLGRLSVLIYHRVPAAPDPLLPGEPSAVDFERTMRMVKTLFNVIPLSEGVLGLKTGKLPARALSITFDDGYADNAEVAAPILKRLGLHATFFIATGYLDGGRMFNDTVIESVRACRHDFVDLQEFGLGTHSMVSTADRRKAIASILQAIKYRPEAERTGLAESIAITLGASLSDNLMMTSGQAAAVASDGFDLGGHTVLHPILAQINIESAESEIVRGRERVDEIAGRRTRLFAYPNGRPSQDYTPGVVGLVRRLGFDGAVTTSPGAARVGSSAFEIPRFTPWDDRPTRFAAQMLRNLTTVVPTYAS